MPEKNSTGNKDFDKFLGGGYEKDIITIIYGPPGSGKSNFCLMAAVETAKQNKKVIYIDTEGSFSVDRLNQLTSLDVLKNILLLKATSFEEQKKAFDTLLKKVSSEKIGLIVIDSLVMLYRLELGLAREEAKALEEKAKEKEKEKIQKVNRELARQLRTLNEIARKKNITILATSQIYQDFESKELKMSGGTILPYWAKCLIELKNTKPKTAVLKKHRSLPEKDFTFTITKYGIKEKKGFGLFS